MASGQGPLNIQKAPLLCALQGKFFFVPFVPFAAGFGPEASERRHLIHLVLCRDSSGAFPGSAVQPRRDRPALQPRLPAEDVAPTPSWFRFTRFAHPHNDLMTIYE